MGQIKFWIDAKLQSLVIDKSEVVCVLQQHRHQANTYEDIVRLTEGCISWQPKLPQILSRIAVFTVLRIYCSYKTVAYVGSFLEEIRWLQSYLLPPPRRLCFACVCLSVCCCKTKMSKMKLTIVNKTSTLDCQVWDETFHVFKLTRWDDA